MNGKTLLFTIELDGGGQRLCIRDGCPPSGEEKEVSPLIRIKLRVIRAANPSHQAKVGQY
jgi:hypothetical protein